MSISPAFNVRGVFSRPACPSLVISQSSVTAAVYTNPAHNHTHTYIYPSRSPQSPSPLHNNKSFQSTNVISTMKTKETYHALISSPFFPLINSATFVSRCSLSITGNNATFPNTLYADKESINVIIIQYNIREGKSIPVDKAIDRSCRASRQSLFDTSTYLITFWMSISWLQNELFKDHQKRNTNIWMRISFQVN